MNTLIVRSLALVAFALPTAAQAQSAASNWTGFYAGLHAGGVWGDGGADVGCDDRRLPNSCAPNVAIGFPHPNYDFSSEGFLGGGQAGYNFQSGNVVIGVETDISWTDFDGSDSKDPVIVGIPTFSRVSQDVDWLGTLRARAGVVSDNMLFYVTGGLAYGDVSYRYSLTAPSVVFTAKDSSSGVQTGWTVGGGAEAKFGQWSIKGEYLYFDLGDEDLKAEWVQPVPLGVFSTVDFEEVTGHIGRIGLNFHFN